MAADLAASFAARPAANMVAAAAPSSAPSCMLMHALQRECCAIMLHHCLHLPTATDNLACSSTLSGAYLPCCSPTAPHSTDYIGHHATTERLRWHTALLFQVTRDWMGHGSAGLALQLQGARSRYYIKGFYCGGLPVAWLKLCREAGLLHVRCEGFGGHANVHQSIYVRLAHSTMTYTCCCM